MKDSLFHQMISNPVQFNKIYSNKNPKDSFSNLLFCVPSLSSTTQNALTKKYIYNI